MSSKVNYRAYIRSGEWYKKRDRVTKMTKKRCVLFPWLRAKDCHHMTYHHLGNEWFIRDIVPLSKIAHWLVHRYLLWKTPARIIVNLILRFLGMLMYFIP